MKILQKQILLLLAVVSTVQLCAMDYEEQQAVTLQVIVAKQYRSELEQIIVDSNKHATWKRNENVKKLHKAVLYGDVKKIKFLLDSKVNVDERITKYEETSLHIAARYGNVAIATLLCNHRANIHEQDNEGETPLHLAVCCGNIDVVRLLVNRDADLDIENNDGKTAQQIKTTVEIRNFLSQARIDRAAQKVMSENKNTKDS